ncbi:DJ-1/PfpI family protein [Psychromonas sp. MME2]|uniref:DJ-1/PfpI family protein n=1 Tax=unclassified Psychromonas TaxID=2614957 RepID=UPI00339BA8FF
MNIAIYIYDNAEVLDFSGPFEVLSTASRLAFNDWNIFFVAQSADIVTARGGFLVKPHYDFSDHPHIDILIVVGGIHDQEVQKTNVISWVKEVANRADMVLSVCTGAFILAQAGLLDGLSVTTHWQDIADLQADYPALTVIDNKRWIDTGKYITSAGISAGIDMSLYLVSRLSSATLAEKTAKQMQYKWANIITY